MEHILELKNNVGAISAEELDLVVNKLEESRNEIDNLMEEIEKEYEDYDNSNDPLEEGEAEFIGDGVLMENSSSNILDFNHFENIDNALDEIIDNNLKDALATNYNLSDDEVIKFANLIMRSRNNDMSNMFDDLPAEVQKHIKEMADEQHIPIADRKQFYQFSAEMIVNELIHDAELDALSIDLEKAMKELIPAPMEMYSEFNKEYIEDEFPKVAESIREEHPKKADNLMAMRQGFIDAYTYSTMHQLLDNNKIVKNVRKAEVMWSRTNTEYLRLAEVCKFHLYPLAEVHKSLMALGFSDIQAKRITTLFVYTYTDKVEDYHDENEYNDIYRNSFANYFEINIKNLTITEDLLTDFSKEIKNNLNELCDHIDSVIDAKEAELSSKKKKKRG